MTSGAVTLRQIHGTREMLDVHCDRCGRAGRYRVATLVETYGLDAGLPALASALEEGCSRKGEHGGCFVVWEGLS